VMVALHLAQDSSARSCTVPWRNVKL